MNYNKIFEERYNKLNKEQKNAVDTIDGPVLVVAGPGTGKTELLSLRTANILKQTDTLPSSILCLTYTDSASFNMRKRLINLIGPDAYKVAIHTFHSFGTEIINQNQNYFQYGSKPETADEIIQIQILEKLIKKLPLTDKLRTKSPDGEFVYLKSIKERIQDMKKEGITSQKLIETIEQDEKVIKTIEPKIKEIFSSRIGAKTIDETGNFLSNLPPDIQKYPIIETLSNAYKEALSIKKATPITKWKSKFLKKDHYKNDILKDSEKIEKLKTLAKIYEEYRAELLKKGYHDYEDMIMETIKALKNNLDLKYTIQEKYLYVMVDEFQDTNGAQMQLLNEILNTELTENRPNILAVGDDDQSIFKFQGATIKTIQKFQKKYTNTKTITLIKNYRSTQNILDIATKIIKQGENRLENIYPELIKKTLQAHTQENGEIIEKELKTEFEEEVFIAKTIKNSKTKLEEIAIIAPKHKHLENIAKVLTYYKIPISYEKKQDLLKTELIIEILDTMQFTISLLNNKTEEADDLLPKILSAKYLEIPAHTIWETSTKAYKEKTGWLETMLNSEDEKIKNLTDFLTELAKYSKTETAEEIIDRIINYKYKDYYFNQNNFENNTYDYLTFLKALEALIRKFRSTKTNGIFTTEKAIELINLHKTHKIGLYYSTYFKNEDSAVNLLTVHKAKGQEFNTTFVIQCQENEWTKGRNNSKLSFTNSMPISSEKETTDDHLRKFFVAITRAKRKLYITSHEYNINGKGENKLNFLTDIKTEKRQGVHGDKIKIMTKEFAKEEKIQDLYEEKFKIEKTQPLNAEKKDLLKSIVKNYKLSVTHLNNFIDVVNGGPQKFLQQNLLRFPQPKNINGIYGTAIHSALYKAQKTLQQKNQLVKSEELIDFFKRDLKSQHINNKTLQKLIEKGTTQLPKYWAKRKNNFNKTDIPEFDFRQQEVVIGNANITGKIDKMQINKKNKEITVIDYKTGKPINTFKGSKEKGLKNKNQLIFYKLLVENSQYFGGEFKVHSGALEFIEADEKTNDTLELNITQEDVEKLTALIKAVYQKIIDLDFPNIDKYTKGISGTTEFIEDLINGYI